MILGDVDWNPTDRKLRQFAVTGALVVAVFCSMAASRSPMGTLVAIREMWLALVAALGLALGGWVFPQALRYPFVGLSLVTIPVGMVVAEIIMLLLWCVLFVPLGWSLRLLGRTPLNRAFADPQCASYWQKKTSATNAASYYRQF